MSMASYKKFPHVFVEGEVLKNGNGYSYEVVECYSPSKVLFKRVKDGEKVIGNNPNMYYKTSNGVTEDVLEWDYGQYV